tara:strand:+ start:1556 stop:3475 length:1920 start_codon:yes stop_codon:yes gene_type:complete
MSQFTEIDYELSTDIADILSNYDTKKLQKEYGDIFDSYDNTRELFTNNAFVLTQDLANAQLRRQQGQLGRQALSGLNQQRFLSEALGRQLESFDLRGQAVQSNLDFAEEAQARALGRTDIQRNALMQELGMQGEDGQFTGGRLQAEQDRKAKQFNIREAELKSATMEAETKIADQLEGLGIDKAAAQRSTQSQLRDLRSQGSLDLIARESAIRESGARAGESQRQQELLNLQTEDLEASSGLRTGQLARQDALASLQEQDLSLRTGRGLQDISRQQELLGMQSDELAQQQDQTMADARGNLFDIYRRAEQSGNFAAEGRRPMETQRAIDSYLGRVGGRIDSLGRAEDRLGIQSEALEDRETALMQDQALARARIGIQRGGISQQIGAEQDRLSRQLQRQDISGERLLQQQDLESDRLGDILGRLGIAEDQRAARFRDVYATGEENLDRIGIREGALGRQIGTEEEPGLLQQALSRQLQGLDLNRGALNDSIARRQLQLEGQVAGLNLTDSEINANLRQQRERAANQLGSLGIQRRGAEAQTARSQFELAQQLAGITESQNFLTEQSDLRSRLAEQERQRSIFNFRDDFARDTRSRLVDLIRSEADLSRFRRGAIANPTGDTGGENFTQTDEDKRTRGQF